MAAKQKLQFDQRHYQKKSKPVHPGESGGQYKPLTDEGVGDIIENSFRILEEIGFNQATPHCIETCHSFWGCDE